MFLHKKKTKNKDYLDFKHIESLSTSEFSLMVWENLNKLSIY